MKKGHILSLNLGDVGLGMFRQTQAQKHIPCLVWSNRKNPDHAEPRCQSQEVWNLCAEGDFGKILASELCYLIYIVR